MTISRPLDPNEKRALPLPALRQDLNILEGPISANGEKTWLIQDIITHKFHTLGQRGFRLLSQWEPLPAPELLNKINIGDEEDFDPQDIEDMCEFLYTHKLTIIPPALDTQGLVAQEGAAHPPWHTQILHKYLFFRIPLFRPQRFLTHSYAWIAPLYSKSFTLMIASLGLIGFWFALEQWDVFKSTFLHFLTFEGVLYYGLTLIILKAIHELGHAYMSTRFGARVPIIGIAFLVMFPILYTDTTDAHRLNSKRERVLIDAAGMLAELCVACLALFAWSFLPDGALRSAAFFAATTSWGLSLAVNLNPFMRFDGYYLMSDLWGQKNMQDRGFALGRWFMRETLFGFGDDIPILCTSRERFWLIIYAYGTWIYRFFLFIGIAVLVHALFPKALGIFLFSVEILFFIISPIVAEMRIWWSLRMKILNNKRSLLTGSGALILAALLMIPWQRTIQAPALLRPRVQTELYAQSPGKVEHIYVTENTTLTQGQLIATLSSDLLEHQKTKSLLRIKLLTAQIARRAADTQDLNASDVLMRNLNKERANLKGIDALRTTLEIRAPHAGRLIEINPALHIGRHINSDFKIAVIVDMEDLEILSFVSDTQIRRIHEGANVRFTPEDIFANVSADKSRIEARLSFIAPTGEEYLNEDIFSSNFRGPIAVEPAKNERSRPVASITKIKATPSVSLAPERALRGIVTIKADQQSPAKSIWRRIRQVLIRETDF